MREQYCQRFSIKSVWGHDEWNNKLRSRIKMGEYSVQTTEDEKHQRINELKMTIKYDKVNFNDMQHTKMILAIPSRSYDERDDWRNKENGQNKKQCGKQITNRYLWDYFFHRAKVADLNYMDLAVFRKDDRYLSSDEDW